jgi:WhiB family redox-sensing transcriptional regulator
MTTQQWRQQAACQNQGHLFFTNSHTHEAKTICRHCPVKQQCLTNALAHPRINGYPLAGIWGGTTQEERMQLLKKKRHEQ